MGVAQITPFLQRACPEVLRSLPDRFRALEGKRIVIDGTLITQRFHFAPMPQEYRHILSWYRLIKHLQASNIQTICVFDGPQRSLAKEKEVKRRRQGRMVTQARGAFEMDRASRLQRLTSTLRQSPPPEADEIEKGFETLKPPVKDSELPALLTVLRMGAILPILPVWSAVEGLRHAKSILSMPLPLKGSSKTTTPPPVMKDVPITYSSSGELESVQQERTLTAQPEILSKSITREEPGGLAPDQVFDAQPVMKKEQPAEEVLQLYAEYCQSIPQLASLSKDSSTDVTLPPSLTSVAREDEDEAAQAECVLSKSQYGLAIEEGALWQSLAGSVESGDIPESVTNLAEALEAKSRTLSESYVRRTRPLTRATYDQCREVLRAMGIPCIEPAGAFEGEALAAALVVNGYADYVASEDTDVLIYDAPLIRNVTSQQGPLTLISGREVRDALELDRERFIDFALLLGTDFTQRIKNVGPTRALKLIREHGSIERILAQEPKYPPPASLKEYLKQIEMARMVFNTLPPMPDDVFLQESAPNEEKVLAVLARYGLSRYAMDDWDVNEALSGNYFGDNPTAL